jgi:ferrous iron transport protein A
MVLSDLNLGDRAVIKNINADNQLKHRLYSFGLVRGEELEVRGCSLGKNTIEVDVDNTLIALRVEEAKKIEVERV